MTQDGADRLMIILGSLIGSGVGGLLGAVAHEFVRNADELPLRSIGAASGAAIASRPPFTAEKCLRRVLISLIGAPEANSN